MKKFQSGEWMDKSLGLISDVSYELDTTIHEAKNGKDIQAMNFNIYPRYSRYSLMNDRLSRYPKEENIYQLENCSKVSNRSNFYEFRLNVRTIGCSISHLQLRHVVKARNKHQVFFMENDIIYLWNNSIYKNKQRGRKEIFLDPKVKFHITCIESSGDIFACGGIKGELVLKRISTGDILFDQKMSDVDNNITNFIDFYDEPNKKWEMYISSNDNYLRIFDQNMTNIDQFKFHTCVNHSTISPCGKMLCLALDDEIIHIIDRASGKIIQKLEGHVDFPFSTNWNKNGYEIATGSQDHTCRIWDIRKGECLHILKSNLTCVRNVRYSNDGTMLACGESADYVHIYDCKSNYKREQLIDFFGEMSGISFSPCGQSLFLGVNDRTYKSLMEFQKISYSMIDEILI